MSMIDRMRSSKVMKSWLSALALFVAIRTIQQQLILVKKLEYSLDYAVPFSMPVRTISILSSSHSNSHSNSDALPKSDTVQTSEALTIQRARFEQDLLSSSLKHNNIVAGFVQYSMSPEATWFKLCLTDRASHRISPVHRSCPTNDWSVDEASRIDPLLAHHCSVTESIELIIMSPETLAGERAQWKIRTLDGANQYKTLGDEFYVTYTEVPYLLVDSSNATISPTAVAIVTDHEDGTYGLDFVSVPYLDIKNVSTTLHEVSNSSTTLPPSHGRIEVFLQYTCYMGTMHQPLKDVWKTGGASNIRVVLDHVLRPPIQSWKERLQQRGGVIRNPPALSSNNNTITDSHNNNNHITSLSQFDTSIFFGDSMLAQMVTTYSHPTMNFFYYPKATSRGNVDVTMSMNSLDVYLQKLEDTEGPRLRRRRRHKNDNTTNVALVIGSASWDVLLPSEWQGPKFDRHLEACRTLIQRLRSIYPGVSIMWRLPTAIHVHRANESCFTLPSDRTTTTNLTQSLSTPRRKRNPNKSRNPCADILRYASTSRMQYLYQQQLQIMLYELHVPVIDLYELSFLSAHHLKEGGDAQHYNIEWNLHNMMEYLYPESRDEIQRRAQDHGIIVF